MNKLSIIVLNYNKKNLLKKCLESIFQTFRSSAKGDKKSYSSGLEIIVVDNGSSDNSVKFVRKFKKSNSNIQIKLIENKQNLGFTGGNNVGIKYALESDADYIMLLNNDVIVKNNFWQPMIDYLEKNHQAGILGPKIYFAPGYEFHQDRYSEEDLGKVIWYAGGNIDWENVYASHQGVNEVDQGQYDQVRQTEFVTGCCMMARREVFENIGLLDNKYFLYYEDSDFCLRGQKNGWQTVYFPKSQIWHLNAGSSKSGSKLQDYYLARNRMLFGMRWAPVRSKLALIRESIKLLFTGRKWQKIGIKDFYLNKFGKGSWNE